MTNLNLNSIGWKPIFQQQLSPEETEDHVVRVTAHTGSQILLLGNHGELSLATKLTAAVGDVAVGDWLVLDSQKVRAIRRLDRLTTIYRKAAGEEVRPQVMATNVDTMFIVSSCTDDFNLSRIERYLALALQAGVHPIVVLTKADLCDCADDLRIQVEKLHSGLLVEAIDARDLAQVGVLTSWCGPGQSVALLGSSGVGKSTIANALGALKLATGATREKDGKGRHTTTVRSIHRLPSGGVLVDTPGMRELQLPGCEEGVANLFRDVFEIAERCRFNNCSHDGDAGCALAAAIETGELDQRRFASFMKLNAEQAHNSRSLAERRERERKTGRFYKSVISEKQRRRH